MGTDGELHVESGIGGALRDLAVLNGDRGTARHAVHATQRALSLLPVLMRPANLILTLRLADAYAGRWGDLPAVRDLRERPLDTGA